MRWYMDCQKSWIRGSLFYWPSEQKESEREGNRHTIRRKDTWHAANIFQIFNEFLIWIAPKDQQWFLDWNFRSDISSIVLAIWLGDPIAGLIEVNNATWISPTVICLFWSQFNFIIPDLYDLCKTRALITQINIKFIRHFTHILTAVMGLLSINMIRCSPGLIVMMIWAL